MSFLVPFYTLYPSANSINKHGWVENGPFEDVFPCENEYFPAMLGYRNATGVGFYPHHGVFVAAARGVSAVQM